MNSRFSASYGIKTARMLSAKYPKPATRHAKYGQGGQDCRDPRGKRSAHSPVGERTTGWENRRASADRVWATETPPHTCGRFCSAPPQWLSPWGSALHRSGPSPAARPPAAPTSSGGTRPVTSRASPATGKAGLVRGQSPSEWYVSLAWSTRPSYARAFPRGNALPRHAHTRCAWQGALCPVSHQAKRLASRKGPSAPD